MAPAVTTMVTTCQFDRRNSLTAMLRRVRRDPITPRNASQRNPTGRKLAPGSNRTLSPSSDFGDPHDDDDNEGEEEDDNGEEDNEPPVVRETDRVDYAGEPTRVDGAGLGDTDDAKKVGSDIGLGSATSPSSIMKR